jgi:protein disulfide-isomerase A6
MRFITALLLGAAHLVLASNVLELDGSNFDDHVGTGRPAAFVEFYAPWCGHCKNLAPTYEQFGDAFASAKDKVQIIKVDADGNGKGVGQRFGVTGFPTLKWFPAGSSTPEDYSGGRELEDLVKFVTEKTGVKSSLKPPPPPVTRMVNVRDFDEVVLDPKKDAFVFFTAPWCGHCKALKPTLEAVSKYFKEEKDCVIVQLDADNKGNSEVVGRYDIQQFPTIKYFPKGDKKEPEPYMGGRSEGDLIALFNEKCGTHRAVGGGLNDKAGRLVDFDSLATQFVNAVDSERHAVLTRTTDLVNDAKFVGEKVSTYAKQYLSIMEKIKIKSVDYVEKERTRLAAILKKRQLSSTKLDEIKVKYNILGSFLEGKEGAKTVNEEEKIHQEL